MPRGSVRRMSDVPPPPSFPPPSPSFDAPPGYVPYGGGPQQPAGTFRSVGGVAKALNVLLAIYIPLQAVGLVTSYQLAGTASDYLDGRISEREFEDAANVNVGSLSGLLVIPIAVLTIIVMFRMAKNLQLLGRTGQRWTPGWAIGGWFCPPLVLYVIPWLMLRELWQGSEPATGPWDPRWKENHVSPLINVWWVLYGLVPLIGIATAAGMFANIRRTTVEDLAQRIEDYRVVNTILGLATVAAAIVFMVLMRQLAQRHMARTGEGGAVR